jgi:N-acetylglucosaminyl-diphospho-decaprenol L-rhamnosyltransferase
MRLILVIVNYRTPALTIDCLRSIEPQVRAMGGEAKVVLTDNLSPDDSVARLRDAITTNGWQAWVDFRPLPSNGGFAYGNNEGIRPYLESQKPDYVLLLNPDTVARDGAITELMTFMDANLKVGIAGSRLEDPDTTPQRSSFRFPRVMSEVEGALRLGPVSKLLSRFVVAPPVVDHVEPTEWVAGASMIIRREVFDAIGLLDERYFMYFEEVDFCLRARRAGWPCMYVPQSRVVHLVGQASGVTDKAKARKRRPAYWFESRRRYFIKNHGGMYALLADASFIVGFALWRLRRAIQRKDDLDPEHFLGDFIRQSVFVKGFRV